MPINFWQIVLFFIGTIAVIFAAYYVSLFIGKKTMKTGSGRNIRLRDRFVVSKDKSFCLLEVKGKIYLVAMTNHTTTLLDTFSTDDFAEEAGATSRSWIASPFNSGSSGASKGFGGAAVRNAISQILSTIGGAAKRRSFTLAKDLDRRVTIQMAQEEDGLDIVNRKMQARREANKTSPPEEGE